MKSEASLIDPAFMKKSQGKQIDLLLAALKRERNRVNELNIKIEIILKDYKSKVLLNQQYLRANEELTDDI